MITVIWGRTANQILVSKLFEKVIIHHQLFFCIRKMILWSVIIWHPSIDRLGEYQEKNGTTRNIAKITIMALLYITQRNTQGILRNNIT